MRVALTIGNFDGVHRGHQALIRASMERSKGATVRALFFDPHPASFFGRETSPLTTVDRRRALLLKAGVNQVDVRPFNAAFAAQSPLAFVENIIASDRNCSHVVVGPDFRFGANRVGDVNVLRDLGQKFGFETVVVDVVKGGDLAVSSTRIRTLLSEGEVAAASDLLGHWHDIGATVVRGDQRGRTIGYPTANLRLEPVVVPKDGVYAVRLRVGDSLLAGMANIGTRPTFNAGRSVEVNLFDFDQDIYDREVRVGFVERLRDEQRFEGIDALITQLGYDKENATQVFRTNSREYERWI